MSPRHGKLRIGTSGYQYDHWRGVVYPAEAPVSRWFPSYAAEFDTVEIDSTFYRLPAAATFAAWRGRAPVGFVYAVKFSRFGTHMKKLLDPEGTIGAFMERARELRGTLGPVLVHLPPRWRVNVARLEAFLEVASRYRGVRWAVEVRDGSWLREEVYAVLRRFRAALCLHDMIPAHPRVLTSGWTYLRFHGTAAGRAVDGAYTDGALRGAARQIRRWLREGIDVYAYFNNDWGGHAVFDAKRLRAMLADRTSEEEERTAALGRARR